VQESTLHAIDQGPRSRSREHGKGMRRGSSNQVSSRRPPGCELW
jgi:hypothetical protein